MKSFRALLLALLVCVSVAFLVAAPSDMRWWLVLGWFAGVGAVAFFLFILFVLIWIKYRLLR